MALSTSALCGSNALAIDDPGTGGGLASYNFPPDQQQRVIEREPETIVPQQKKASAVPSRLEEITSAAFAIEIHRAEDTGSSRQSDVMAIFAVVPNGKPAARSAPPDPDRVYQIGRVTSCALLRISQPAAARLGPRPKS